VTRVFKALFAVGFVLAVLGFALHVAHEHDNSAMCEKYGGKGAFYKGGSCWSPMGRLDG
jgi:hypothetical protein